MAKKSYFTKKELKEFRKLLEEKKQEVVEDLRLFSENIRNHDVAAVKGDAADIATSETESALQARIQSKKRKLLDEINHALGKFEIGNYGICEGSEEYIGKPRLRIRPWTRYSIEYKEYVDEMKKRNR